METMLAALRAHERERMAGAKTWVARVTIFAKSRLDVLNYQVTETAGCFSVLPICKFCSVLYEYDMANTSNSVMLFAS